MIGEIEKRACESSNCQEGKDSLGFQGGRLKNESPEARNQDKKCLINTNKWWPSAGSPLPVADGPGVRVDRDHEHELPCFIHTYNAIWVVAVVHLSIGACNHQIRQTEQRVAICSGMRADVCVHPPKSR
jgi:hypothetical protein